jgi:hypothetical protein
MGGGCGEHEHGGSSTERPAMPAVPAIGNLLERCFRRHPASPAAAARPESEERPLGCGWFDSSHELAQGARVTELDDAATPLWQWAARTQA